VTRRRRARARAAAAAGRRAAAQGTRPPCQRGLSARARVRTRIMLRQSQLPGRRRLCGHRAACPARPACLPRRLRAALSACERARSQVLCFIDLGGHERVLKTAVYGLTCMLPDAVLLCVSARRAAGAGRGGEEPGGGPDGAPGRLLPRAAREHQAVALALDVPLAVIVTQVGLG